MRKFRYILLLLNAAIFSKNIDAQNFIYSTPAIEDSWGIIDVLEEKDGYLFTSSDYNRTNDSVFCNLVKITKNGNFVSDELLKFSAISRSEYFTNIKGQNYLTILALESDPTINQFIEINLTTKEVKSTKFNQRTEITFNDILILGDSAYVFTIFDIENQINSIVRFDRRIQKFNISTKLDLLSSDLKLNLTKDKIINKGGNGIEVLSLTLDSILKTVGDATYGSISGDILPLNNLNLYINTGGQLQDLIFSDHRDTIDFGIDLLNADLLRIKNTHYGRKGDTVDIPARTQSIASTNGGFYFGGTSNFKIWEYPYGFERSWFMIMKTDSALNLEWTKEYGGDAYYFMTGIMATSDGGGIAYGTRQDTTKGNFNRDPFMIKFDKNGMITFTKTFPQTKKMFAVYPNPASNTLNVKFEENLITKFIITNTEGKVLKEILGDQIDEKIDISNLLSGLYFISGYNKTLDLVGTQKLIVKK